MYTAGLLLLQQLQHLFFFLPGKRHQLLVVQQEVTAIFFRQTFSKAFVDEVRLMAADKTIISQYGFTLKWVLIVRSA